jgi:cellulose synthase (UDP-forming)
MPAKIMRADGTVFNCSVKDYSDRGVGIKIESSDLVHVGEEVKLLLKHGLNEFAFPGMITYSAHYRAGIHLNEFTLKQNIDFIQCTFARPEIWSSWQDEFSQDKPLQSMREVFALDLRGYFDIIEHTPPVIRNILEGFTGAVIWIGSFIPHRPMQVHGFHRLSNVE